MLAVRKLKNEPGLWLQRDTPTPQIGPRDVLVAVTHAGICGTDRHIYEWDAWSKSRVKLGITTGHEFVGRVQSIGMVHRSGLAKTALERPSDEWRVRTQLADRCLGQWEIANGSAAGNRAN